MEKSKKNKKCQDWYRRTESILYKYNFMRLGLEEMIIEYRSKANDDGLGAMAPGGTGGIKTNKVSSIVESTFINRNSAALGRLAENIRESKRLIKKINKIFSNLPDDERQVMDLYYFKGKKIYQIAAELNYSEKTIKNYKSKAVEKFAIGLAFAVVVEINSVIEEEQKGA